MKKCVAFSVAAVLLCGLLLLASCGGDEAEETGGSAPALSGEETETRQEKSDFSVEFSGMMSTIQEVTDITFDFTDFSRTVSGYGEISDLPWSPSEEELSRADR